VDDARRDKMGADGDRGRGFAHKVLTRKKVSPIKSQNLVRPLLPKILRLCLSDLPNSGNRKDLKCVVCDLWSGVCGLCQLIPMCSTSHSCFTLS
jgi:hypothetical protein